MSHQASIKDIAKSFQTAAITYDEHAILHREICDRMQEKLQYLSLTPSVVLDLGCNTGRDTERLSTRFPDAQVIAFDIALPMLQQTRQKCSSAAIAVCGNAHVLPFAAGSIDFIYSNLVLQWCDLEKVLAECYRVLRPGGCLFYSSYGPDTLIELRSAWYAVDPDYPHVHDFRDMHNEGDAMMAAGFTDPVIDIDNVTLAYESLDGLMQDLKGVGAHNVLPGRRRGLMGKSLFQRFREAYESFRDNNGLYPLSYEIIYGHAWVAQQKSRTHGTDVHFDLSNLRRPRPKSDANN